MRRAADALGCDLVYALVPRINLDETVRRNALARAEQEVRRVDLTMHLEDQAIHADELQRRIEEFATGLVDTPAVWDAPGA